MEYASTGQRLMDLLRLLGDAVQEDAAALFLQRLVQGPELRLAAVPRGVGAGYGALQRYDLALRGWMDGVIAQLSGHSEGAVIAALVRASSALSSSLGDGSGISSEASEIDVARHVVALEEAAQLVALYAEALLGR